MIGKLVQAAILVASGLAISGFSGCTPKTAAPAKKPAAPDYQAAVPSAAPAANIRAICYTDADLVTIRGRMLQQELTVATPYRARCGEEPLPPRDLTLRRLAEKAIHAVASMDARAVRSASTGSDRTICSDCTPGVASTARS